MLRACPEDRKTRVVNRSIGQGGGRKGNLTTTKAGQGTDSRRVTRGNNLESVTRDSASGEHIG
eukprot:13484111-Heterocapsa_arctica.AAC.1